ncbi:MAG: TonB family protein [Hyphomonadaceae bacterium]
MRVVRLVSFGASAALATLVLLALGSLRYAPMWLRTDAPPVTVVSEIWRPPPAALRPPAPTRVIPHAEPRETEAPPLPLPEAPIDPVVITSPVWVERPRNPERYYPRDAFMRGIAGEVVLDCDVDVDGRLSCAVASETPAGQGFGDAALRIASAHVMRPAMLNGTPVRGRYRMVVPFSPSG